MERAEGDDIFLFEGFRLDRHGGGLFRRAEDGALVPLPIGPRALDVLGALVERAGELVTRDEIIAAAWPDTVVEDNNLNMQIAALRRVLDEGRTPGCIQTIPRRGYRFIVPVTRAGGPEPPAIIPAVLTSPMPHAHSVRKAVMAGMAGTLMLLVLATAAWKVHARWFPPVPPARLSIVVLPFANLAGDQEHRPGQQYLVDAVTEDLTTDLSRLADMRVISCDTAFTYRDKPANTKRIGRELGVRYVLEGSVERSGDQVRVNAQLIDAETDTHLWADRFDRGVGDLLALQNDITARIAIALNLRLIASEAERPTEHPDVLDHIFRGRAAIDKPASPQSFAAAMAEFDQALSLDPLSVEAEGRMAAALASRVLDKMSDTARADVERANGLVAQALTAAPDNPLAHFAKGQLLRARHRCDQAIPEYEAVVSANRNAITSIGNIGRCEIYLGQIDQGIALEEQAIELSPRDPFLGVWYFRIGQGRMLQSRTEDALQWLEKAHDANGKLPVVAAWLAAAYGLEGDMPHAAAALAEARRLSRTGWPTSVAAERTGSAREFTTRATRALVEATYLAGLRKAGVQEE